MSVTTGSSPGASLTWLTDTNTWASDPFTWGTANSGTAWTATATEGWTNSDLEQQATTKKILEAWATSELEKQAFTHKELASWTSSDAMNKVWNSLLKPTEGWTTSELEKQNFTHKELAGWTNTEVQSHTWNSIVKPLEGWNTSELEKQNYVHKELAGWTNAEIMSHTWSSLVKSFEGWNTSELEKQNFTHKELAGWATSEFEKQAFTKYQFLEGWNTSELEKQSYIRKSLEGWNSAELNYYKPTKMLYDSWNSAESISHTWSDFLKVLEGWNTAETPKKTISPYRWAESWNTAELEKQSYTKPVSESVTISNTNLWSGVLNIYNNYGNSLLPATLTLLSETYCGMPIYRLAMTPMNSAVLSSCQTDLWSHGIYGSYMTYLANIPVCSSIYWRNVPGQKPVNVGLGASNIAGWSSTITNAQADGWNLSYNYMLYGSTQADNKFYSYCCPTIASIGETMYIDFCSPRLDWGVTIPRLNQEVKFGYSDLESEGWHTVDSESQSTSKKSLEGWTTTELEKQAYTKYPFIEGWNTSENAYRNFTKKNLEGWTSADAVSSFSTIKKFLEVWNSAEVAGRGYTPTAWNEGWNTADIVKNNPKPVFGDGWTTAEGAPQTWNSDPYTWANAPDIWVTAITPPVIFNYGLIPHEGWHVTEIMPKGIAPSPFIEGWHTSDSAIWARLMRFYEAWTTSENASRNPNKISPEGWNTADGNAPKSFNFSKVTLETLHFIEMWTDLAQYHISVCRSLSFAEFEKQVFTKYPFLEGWNTAELEKQNYTKYPFSEGWNTSESEKQNFTKRTLEGWVTAELEKQSYTNNQYESWHTVEFEKHNFTKQSIEGWLTSELEKQAISKSLIEGWNTAEVEKQNFNRYPFAESWHTSDVETNSTIKKNLEGWITAELEKESFTKAPFAEGWNTSDASSSRNPSKKVSESWTTLDSNKQSFVKALIQAWTTSDAFSRTWNTSTRINELWNMAEVIRVTKNLNISEAIHAVDSFLRHSNAVINDLVISTKDLNSSNFGTALSPAGYTAFQNLSTGDYTYQNAIVKVVLQAGLTSSVPNVQDLQLNIDVPDVNDNGTVHLTPSNQPLTVHFNATFHSSPEIGAIPIGLADVNGKISIDSISQTGFVVELKDGGTYLDGYISWTANGY